MKKNLFIGFVLVIFTALLAIASTLGMATSSLKSNNSTSQPYQLTKSSKKRSQHLYKLINAKFSKANGDTIKVGENFHLQAGKLIKGDLIVIAANAKVDGEITGDIVVVGGNLRLGKHAQVNGDINVIGGEIKRADGAIVLGSEFSTGKLAFLSVLRHLKAENLLIWLIAARIISLIGFIALAILVAALFPDQVKLASDKLEKNYGNSLLWGAVGLLLIFPTFVLLIFSIIGILLIPVFIIFLIAAFWFGWYTVSFLIGKRIIEATGRQTESVIPPVVLGILVISAIRLVPLIGSLTTLTVILFGFGTALSSKFGTGKPWFKKNLTKQ
jgi:hypothetical protein